MLVGTPGPELLMKISSEPVSDKYNPTPSFACLCGLCVAIARVNLSILLLCSATTTSALYLFCSEDVNYLNSFIFSSAQGLNFHFYLTFVVNS